MQCQLYCTARAYCDFIVWLKEDFHIERIFPDENFMISCITKADHFFKVAILPELTGKFFSRPSTPASHTEEVSGLISDSLIKDDANIEEKVYCYCRKAESGQMIGCDNPSCSYEWFHFECLKITTPPKKKSWFCPDCRKLPVFKKKSKK